MSPKWNPGSRIKDGAKRNIELSLYKAIKM